MSTEPIVEIYAFVHRMTAHKLSHRQKLFSTRSVHRSTTNIVYHNTYHTAMIYYGVHKTIGLWNEDEQLQTDTGL